MISVRSKNYYPLLNLTGKNPLSEERVAVPFAGFAFPSLLPLPLPLPLLFLFALESLMFLEAVGGVVNNK